MGREMTNSPITPAAATAATTSPARAGSASTAGSSGPADVMRTLTLPEDVAPVTLLGARDEVLRAVEGGFPDVDLHVRGTTVTITGEQSRVDVVVLLLSELIDVARAGAPLTPSSAPSACWTPPHDPPRS